MSCHKQVQRILTVYAKDKKDATQDKKATKQDKRTFEGQKGQNEAIQDKRAEKAPILALSFLEDLACSLARGYRASFQISMDYEPFTI